MNFYLLGNRKCMRTDIFYLDSQPPIFRRHANGLVSRVRVFERLVCRVSWEGRFENKQKNNHLFLSRFTPNSSFSFLFVSIKRRFQAIKQVFRARCHHFWVLLFCSNFCFDFVLNQASAKQTRKQKSFLVFILLKRQRNDFFTP